jgi:hypothetical protein
VNSAGGHISRFLAGGFSSELSLWAQLVDSADVISWWTVFADVVNRLSRDSVVCFSWFTHLLNFVDAVCRFSLWTQPVDFVGGFSW